MNFESKYLIRWGIPGWVLIFWVVYYYFVLRGIDPMGINVKDGTKVITTVISLTVLGVPIGYLLHQLYFVALWIFNKSTRKQLDNSVKEVTNFPYFKDGDNENIWGNNTSDDYYQFEYVWHKVLLDKESEIRSYWESRYRHLLSTIHGLGSLFASLIVSLIASAGIVSFQTIHFSVSFFLIFGIVIQALLFISVTFNYVYYSNNLKALQTKIMKEHYK
ncbi:hypothetical protein ACQCPP_31655 (plasmid) [Priestia megaterium]|uniref:hypothetical protein n=1 Tax=Priestia megaterium TaxID=1404 RepID=UPI003D04EBA7